MITREQVIEIAGPCGISWEYELDLDMLEMFAAACYRMGVMDSAGVADVDSYKAISNMGYRPVC